MEKYVSIFGGIEMGRSFQFYCMVCDLNLILYHGIRKSSKINSVNFFCFDCNKVSHHDQCIICGEKLYYTIKIPEELAIISTEEDIPLEIKIVCPRCDSLNTVLTLVGEWDCRI